MVERSQGRRISEFPAIGTIQDSDEITYISQGVNFRMTYGDFLDTLGVTGTIVQDGASGGTPILDTQGTVNNIRNLEGGSGIKTQTSPENGAQIDHDFLFDGTGQALSDNPSAAQPKFKSISAGTGISVVTDGDKIVVAQSAVPGSAKTVIVNEVGDFPAPAAGIITLADSTEYRLINDIDVGANRFVVGAGSAISGANSDVTALTYTGSGIMFTGLDQSFRLERIKINCASGTVWDMTDTTPFTNLYQIDNVTIACLNLGTLTNMGAVQITNTAWTGTGTGIVWSGASGGAYVSDRNIGVITSANPIYDLTGATLSSWTNVNSLYTLDDAGSFLLKGDADSANVTSLGTLTNARIDGTGTPLSGITSDDALWQFFANDDIADTRTEGLLSLQGNSTNTGTAAAGQGVAVLVAGTWVVELQGQTTGTDAGRITINTGKVNRLPIDASVTINPASGGSQTMALYIAVNGSVIANSKRTATASPTVTASITAVWQIDADPADFVEIFVANDSAATDVLVSSAILRVN